jgi:hypothetical protein
MEQEASLLCSQLQDTDPYPQRDESSPHIHISFFNINFFLVSSVGVGLSPLGTSANIFFPMYQPRMTDDECGVIGGMRIGRGN